MGLDPGTLGSRPELKAGAQPLSRLGAPIDSKSKRHSVMGMSRFGRLLCRLWKTWGGGLLPSHRSRLLPQLKTPVIWLAPFQLRCLGKRERKDGHVLEDTDSVFLPSLSWRPGPVALMAWSPETVSVPLGAPCHSRVHTLGKCGGNASVTLEAELFPAKQGNQG